MRRIPYIKPAGRLPPLCRGRWLPVKAVGGGVRLDFVGDYRTIAFTVPVAYTPSVTPKGVTAQ